MEINDDYILNKYWKTKQQTFSRLLKSNKCLKEEIDYVKTRYNDSLSIEETLYRMKHHIEEHPKCKICGKLLKWHYEYKTYCSKHCMMLDPALKEKRINGSIRKFGSKSSFSSKEVIAKRNLTWEKKYGGNPLKNDAIRHKIKHTCLEKYGVEYASQSNNSKFRYKQTCLEKYGVDNYAKTNECKNKVRKTCLKKYGDYFCNSQEANEKSHTKEANEKRYASMIKNNSWSTSKPEEDFYHKLCTYFNNSDIIRQYKDKRYPFHCDFYIKSLDLFIECNFHWTHGKHLYNPNSQEDIDIVNKWKSKNTKYYNKAIETWTIRDIKKDKYVKENNLHYVSLYNEDDVSNFYIDLEDKILNMNKEFDFEEIESIECLGPCQDDYVYDIEVEDNTHTFIADDILVHNSVYTSYGNFFKCWTEEALKTVPTRDDKINWILKFNQEYLDQQNCDWIQNELYGDRNCKSVHKFELETVNEAQICLKKKKYLKALSWSKGKWFNPSKMTGVGIELIKTTSPKIAKEIITDMTKSLVYECGTMPKEEYALYFNQKLAAWKKKFYSAPIEDISQSINVGAYKKYVVNDVNELVFEKRTPVSVKCAARFNYLANKNNQNNLRITQGQKIKYYNIRLNSKETDYFGFPAGELPSWAPQPDKTIQWQKNVIDPINRFLEVMDVPMVNASGTIEFDLFAFA